MTTQDRPTKPLDSDPRPNFGHPQGPTAPVSGQVKLVEPLTERELAVLRVLPSELTQREMSDELYVSLNTIKSHVKAVFRKLSVSNRQQAVERARQLELP